MGQLFAKLCHKDLFSIFSVALRIDALYTLIHLFIFETIEINKRHRASLRQVNTGKKRAKPGEEKMFKFVGSFLV